MDCRRVSSSSAASSPSTTPSNISSASSCPSGAKTAVVKVEPLPAASPPEPSNASSPSSCTAGPQPSVARPSPPEVMARRCSWCSALHTEQTAAIVTDEQCFCNELCFAHSRRARFKRSKGGATGGTAADDSATSTGASRPLLSGPSSSTSSSAERTPSNSVSPRGVSSERPHLLAAPFHQRGVRHRLFPGRPLSSISASVAPPCCGVPGASAAVDAIGGIFPGASVAPAAQTVFVPVPLPIPIPIFKSAPELLDIMRRYNFRPATPPAPAAICVPPSLGGQPLLAPPLPPRAASVDDGGSGEEGDDQALDLSLPKGLDADLRHLTEASYYKSRRQLILDKPYTKGGGGTGHFHRRSFKAMRRK